MVNWTGDIKKWEICYLFFFLFEYVKGLLWCSSFQSNRIQEGAFFTGCKMVNPGWWGKDDQKAPTPLSAPSVNVGLCKSPLGVFREHAGNYLRCTELSTDTLSTLLSVIFTQKAQFSDGSFFSFFKETPSTTAWNSYLYYSCFFFAINIIKVRFSTDKNCIR